MTFKSFFKREEIDPDAPWRVLRGREKNDHLLHTDNAIRTTKYTPISWLPKSLFLQFRRAANIYFLIISILTLMSFSPQQPAPMIGAFGFILFVTSIKDGVEDIGRYKQDKEVNNKLAQVIDPETGLLRPMEWQNLRVGDVICLEKDESIPADVLVLASAEPSGKVFIDTANLDGETNLKERNALAETAMLCRGFRYPNAVNANQNQNQNPTQHSLSRAQSRTFSPVHHQFTMHTSNSHPHTPAQSAPGTPKLSSSNIHDNGYTGNTNGNGNGASFNRAAVYEANHQAGQHPSEIVFEHVGKTGGVLDQTFTHIAADLTRAASGLVPTPTQPIQVAPSNPLAELFHSNIELTCEQPNESLVRMNGSLTIGNGPKIPVSMDNMLLRGCTCRTFDAIALVVYTGHDTRSMRNSSHPPSKVSNILKMMNRILYGLFAAQAVLCLAYAILSLIYKNTLLENHWYAPATNDSNGFEYIVVKYFTFMIIYSNLIPISLYVGLEVLKLVQGYLVSNDEKMYYEPSDGPTRARTSDLVEELGQVEFVFSDKTGTLTSNVMIFRKCSVGGSMFGYLNESEALKESGSSLAINSNEPTYWVSGDRTPFELLSKPNDPRSAKIQKFFMHMCLCHTVFAGNKPDVQEVTLQASSPDELALVRGAEAMGFQFIERTQTTLTVETVGRGREQYKILHVLPFNSTRKRMSIMLGAPNGDIILFSKGADSVMLPLCSLDTVDKEKDMALLQQHIDDFAREGLRTLISAQKTISPENYLVWAKKFHEASVSLEDREEKIDIVSAEIERDMDLVGSSAIEDKLQDGVPDTIELLLKAGIRVWVLTGDKQETAIEIAKTCKLIGPETETLILSSRTAEEFESKLTQALTRFNISPFSTNKKEKAKQIDALRARTINMTVVVDGMGLVFALQDAFAERFLAVSLIASSCICCRVSPKQKSLVVRLVKINLPVITLSIGDGANDVSMIQTAHIGVGINGKEGSQAVQSADYSTYQFRFLSRLMLVHGRWGYRRVCWFICYYFYKNLVPVFVELFFPWYCGFSGQLFFPQWLSALYNAFFTSWPALFCFGLEQDVTAETSLRYPLLYAAGPRNKFFNYKVFYRWVALAGIHGCIIFYFSVGPLDGVVDSNGHPGDLAWIGSAAFTSTILVVGLKLIIESNFWPLINALSLTAAIVWYLVCFFILCSISVSETFQPELLKLAEVLLGNPKVWLMLLCTVVACLSFDYLFKAVSAVWFPNPVQIIMERERALKTESTLSVTQVKVNRPAIRLYPSVDIEMASTLSEPRMSWQVESVAAVDG
eukprot:GILK01004553.1.p1 GENE.GILK01004553.1~~GILK01004553.1.p1  ORF type:complete len:1297 (-),score=268.93 GILK01004553.1:216-4106(-)